jgi:hypothetical protein
MLPALFRSDEADEEIEVDEDTKEIDKQSLSPTESALASPHISGSRSSALESGYLCQTLKDDVTVVGWRLAP